MNHFTKVPRETFSSRGDKDDLRLGDWVEKDSPSANAWVIAGYPDDEGITLNGGRAGASGAPTQIRQIFYKLTPSLAAKKSFYDGGDLQVSDASLNERHQQAKEAALNVLKRGQRWIAFGGGHDYGYADGAAFLTWAKDHNVKPLVINFDSHLDVRSNQKSNHSGTPFYRLLNEFNNFSLLEIGLQNQCNSLAHLAWAKERRVGMLMLDEINHSNLTMREVVLSFIMPYLEHRPVVYLSVDLDAFSSAFAPGCSQSWPTGLDPNHILPVIDILCQRAIVKVLGLYETSPALDTDSRTSRLAAQIAHRVIFSSGDN